MVWNEEGRIFAASYAPYALIPDEIRVFLLPSALHPLG
jgi:hypothetical protein